MNCTNGDQDLLLLAHGELSPLRGTIVQAHVSRCPRCQERMEQFVAVSRHVARAVRGTNSAVWTFPQRPARRRSRALLWIPIGVALAAAVLTGVAVSIARSHVPSPPRPALQVSVVESSRALPSSTPSGEPSLALTASGKKSGCPLENLPFIQRMPSSVTELSSASGKCTSAGSQPDKRHQ